MTAISEIKRYTKLDTPPEQSSENPDIKQERENPLSTDQLPELIPESMADGIIGRDEDTWRIAFERMNSVLVRYYISRGSNLEAAEDQAQNAWVKIITNLDKYNKEHGRFNNWVWTVARNSGVDDARKLKRREATPLVENLPALLNVEEEAIKSELIERLTHALESLSNKHRRLTTLALAGYSYNEIHDIVGIPKGTVHTHTRQGKNELRQKLADLDPRF